MGTPYGNLLRYESQTGLFAPSKFCAYSVFPALAASQWEGSAERSLYGALNVKLYSLVNGGSHALDGTKAVNHLTRGLGLRPQVGYESTEVLTAFHEWHAAHSASINLHPSGPLFLLSPRWYT